MEYKFTMEVKLKGEEINPAPQRPAAPAGMVKLDPKLIATILPQILSAVSQPQPNPAGQPPRPEK